MLEKLLWNNDLIGKILAKMDRAIFDPVSLDKFHINFKSRVMGIDTAGKAQNFSYDPSTGYFSADVVMNTIWIDSSTQLATAQTLIHEIMHAYLRSILYRYYYTLNSTLIANMSYDSVFSAYTDSLLVRHTRAGINTFLSGNYQYDHDFMADHFLDRFAEVLKFMDDNRVANKRYYWFLAWAGLYKTKTWQYHWPNYPNWPPGNPAPSEDSTRGLKYAWTTQRIDSIRNAISNEERGTASALGRPKIPGACY